MTPLDTPLTTAPGGRLETVRQLAFEGAVTPWLAATLGLGALALTAWLLWRERGALGAWAWLLFALRAAATGLVLWMLAGPTRVVLERHTRPTTVAVFVDRSESMTVADAAAPADDLRWSLAASADAGGSAVALCDRASVALREASGRAATLVKGVEAHAPLGRLKQGVASLRTALNRGAELIGSVAAGAEGAPAGIADRADRLLGVLEVDAGRALSALEDALERGARAEVSRLEGLAERLAEACAAAARRAESLSGDAAGDASAGAPSAGARPRAALVDGAVGRLREGIEADAEAPRRVRFFDFATRVTPADGPEGAPPLVEEGSDPGGAYAEPGGAFDTDADPQAGGTDLTAVLESLAVLQQRERVAMALVYTDGRHNVGAPEGPAEGAARLADVPLYLAPVGAGTPLRDLMILRSTAPSAVALDDTFEVEALVTAFDCEGERVDLVLRLDGRELERRTLVLDGARVDRREAFRLKADALGWRQYDLEVETLDNEASVTNNLATVAVEVVPGKLTVLLADHAPRWEYRYLQQLFRRDEHIEFDEVLFLPGRRATGAREASGALPTTADEWSRYDVAILGDLDPREAPRACQESLAEWVTERGGNLILIAGSERMPASFAGQPLMELAPVLASDQVDPQRGFVASLPEGAQLASCVLIREGFAESQDVWRSAFTRVPLYGLSAYAAPKPATQVLVEALPLDVLNRGDEPQAEERLALFCWRQIGAGRVAYLSAPQSYVLRFRRGDRDHHAFWGQTLRWITATQAGPGADLVRIVTDRASYPVGEPIEATVWLKDREGRPVPDAELRLEATSRDQTLASTGLTPDPKVPGRYAARLTRLPIGAIELAPVGDLVETLTPEGAEPPRVTITVQARAGVEMLNTQSNVPLLEQLAAATGGQVIPPTAAPELLELASLDPVVTESAERTPQWNRWSYLLTVLGCLMTEWAVRKFKGLV